MYCYLYYKHKYGQDSRFQRERRNNFLSKMFENAFHLFESFYFYLRN